MKKVVSLLIFIAIVIPSAWSQLCTPDTTHFTSGNYVYPAVLPCINAGNPYSGVISIKIPDSIDAHLFSNLVPANTYYLHIDSMKIDSIVGMPTGITAVSNPGAGVWMHGGSYACATFAGTTTAAVGSYPLGVYGSGCVHGTIVTFVIDTCVKGDLSSFFNYNLNVCNGSTGACTVDTAALASANVAPSSLPCITHGQAYSGTVSIKIPSTFGFGQLYIDSIFFTNIAGLPTGINAASSPQYGTWLKPGDYACATFSGTTADPAGRYDLAFSGTGCGHFSIGGNTYDSCFYNFNFAQVYPYHVDVCNGVGIADISEAVALGIFPNPNQGSFTVTIATAGHISGEMSVIDVLGRSIHSTNVDVAAGTRQIPLTLHSAAPGVYSLVINANGKWTVKQFIIE